MKQLFETIADRLRSEIQADNRPFLDSTSALCRRYDVSRPTIRKALALLTAEGLTRTCRYGRASIVGRMVDKVSRVSSCDKFASKLRDEIRSGVFQSGTALPKVAFFTSRDNVSSHTVLDALNALCAEQIVHCRGRSYIVGHRPVRLDAASPSSAILVLTPRPKSWSKLLGSTRVQQFVLSFTLEAQRCGIRLIELPLPRNEALFADWRRDALEPHLEGCIGLLVEGAESEGVSIPGLLPLLSAFHLPLVWFDKNDEGAESDILWNWVCRCRTSEQAVVQAALEYLGKWGHRSVAYVHTGEGAWQHARGELLERIWLSRHPHNRIVIEKVHEVNDWISGAPRLRADLERLLRLGPDPARQAIKLLSENRKRVLRVHRLPKSIDRNDVYAPVFALCCSHFQGTHPVQKHWRELLGRIWSGLAIRPCLEVKATALVAANDAAAMSRHVHWISDSGLSCPNDLSLISFDNKYWSTFHPLTTVDFGYAYLGYQALHAILGDTPVERDRHGWIVARPQVIDGGTVRRPSGIREGRR